MTPPHLHHRVSFAGVGGAAPPSAPTLAFASLERAIAALGEEVARNTKANRKAQLERLLIRPTFSVASSGSGARSPKTESERFQLKVAVIGFYGLWDPATAELTDIASRRVFTMLPPAGAAADGGSISVSFKEAILSHIWPSSLASESDAMRRLLGLPEAFHLCERNFLVLHKAAESAFDADALLLLPIRAEPPAPPGARARVFRLADYRTAEADSGAKARVAVAALSGRALFLPRAADGRVPFLRLLAWKAVSALRAGAEADEGAAAAIPPEIDVDATLSRGRDSHGRGSSGFAELLSVGLVFGFGTRA